MPDQQRVAPHRPQRRAVGEGELALDHVAVPLVQGAVAGAGRLVVRGHAFPVGPCEHVAQEGGADAAALHGGHRRQELAVVQRLRRVVALEDLGELGVALHVGADELLQRLAERLLPLLGEQLRARWQPDRGTVAIGGQICLSEGYVGCDVQFEQRLDELPATVLVGKQPLRHRVVEEPGSDGGGDGGDVAEVGAADAEIDGRCEGHRVLLCWWCQSTMTKVRPPAHR